MKRWFCALSLMMSASAFAQVQPITEVFAPDASQYPADKYDKVAVVAWVSPSSSPITTDPKVAEDFKAENRAALEGYIREAASNGAKMIITPEFGVVGYPDIPELPPEEDNFQNPEQIAPYAEPIPGTSTKFFGNLARSLKVYIQFGMAEKDPVGTNVFHNTAVVVGPNGSVVAQYRKIHLYQIETNYLVPGDTPVTYDSPYGKIGLLLCSDVYANEILNKYTALKTDILSLSTSWAQYNTGWSTFTKSARQTNMYLLAANQTYFPDSGVINPDGSAQSHIRQSTGVAYGYLPKK